MYGATSAAAVLLHMLPTFLSLQFGSMVGMGGGAPGEKVDNITWMLLGLTMPKLKN